MTKPGNILSRLIRVMLTNTISYKFHIPVDAKFIAYFMFLQHNDIKYHVNS